MTHPKIEVPSMRNRSNSKLRTLSGYLGFDIQRTGFFGYLYLGSADSPFAPSASSTPPIYNLRQSQKCCIFDSNNDLCDKLRQ